MIRGKMRPSPAWLTLAVLACLPGNARANFQYIPDSNAPAPSSDSMATPAAPSPAPVSRTSIMPETAPAKTDMSGGETIVGFGSQVPLVIALRQIVPANYQFAYADGIPLGTLVDWKGGKPWREVMANVISPLGLTAAEKSMVIYIDRAPQ